MYESPEAGGKPADDDPKLPPEEQEKRTAHASRLQKRIKSFWTAQADRRKTWERNRKAVDGDIGGDGEKGLVRVNLIASTVNVIQPNIYAKSPEVAVEPEERLDPDEYQNIRGFAKTLEAVLGRYAIRGANMKTRGKEAVRASLTCSTGWVKLIYQREKREDPLIRNRINDSQDDILRVEQLLRETKDEGQCAEYQAKLQELQQLVAGLGQKLEVTISDGLVLDNVQPENILILDKSVCTIDEYTQASAIAHGVYMTVGAYKAQFGGKEPPKKATRYSMADTDGEDQSNRGRDQSDPDDQLVFVWEVWSKDDQTVYTQCAGASEYCRDPYQPATLGAQWYPFFPLQLWRVNGTLQPRSMVDNLVELVDEYNTRRTTAAEHRRKNMPVRLLNKASGISDAELDAINRRSAQTDIIGISADPANPLQDQLGHLPEVPYNRDMYDTTDILRDVEMVSGAQDASRGGINQAKTATEAEIMAQGMQSRTSEQLDTIEDWLTAILSYAAQLLMQNLTEEQVKAQFGQSAVWPTLSKQEMFAGVMVQIRAGSTSKPNKMRERDQWLEFLPQMQEAVMKISELTTTGNVELAGALVELLDETLRRFDERMTIREFLPGDENDDPNAPPKLGGNQMLQQVQAKVQELTEQAEAELAQRRDELDKQEAALSAKATDLQVREIKQRATEDVAGIKAQYEDAARKLAEDRFAMDMEDKARQMDAAQQAAAQQSVKDATDAATAAAEPADDAAEVSALQTVLEGQAELFARIGEVLAAVAAPRRTVLIRDEQGRAAESVSQPITEGK